MVLNPFKPFIVFALLLSTLIFADDQNSSLVNADKTVYINLLKTLKSSPITNDEIALQKVLLDKLINTQPATITKAPLNAPENIDEYSNLFNRYNDNALRKVSLDKKINSIALKIKTLEKEIKSLDANSTSIRTLQLQNALYTKSLQEFKDQSDALAQEMLSIEKMLTESLKNIPFDPENQVKKTATNREEALKLRTTVDNFLVKKERFELLGDNLDRGVSAATITAKEEAYTKALRATITSLFLEFSNALKSKNEKAFALEKSILDEGALLDKTDGINESMASLLHAMEKKYFGTLDTLAGSTTQEFKNILKSTWGILTEPIFTTNGTPITALKLILAFFIFIIGGFGGGFYKTSIKRIANNSKSINLATRTILANIGYYVILLTAFFIALNVLGIDLSSIALVAGALSVGIGFGLQNIVSNLVSGIILMFERSIKIGDFVELSGTVHGHVTDIRMRSTTLNTNGNIDVIVPNRNFIENNVINWTMHDKIKRFDIPFGVAYGNKPEHVIAVIKEAVVNSGYADIIEAHDKFTNVIMSGMGSSSVDFILQVWIHGEEILAPSKTMSRFLIIIYNTLNAHGIEIPFPQQDVHIKSIDKESCLSISQSQSPHVEETKLPQI
ncbi:mechanosensitive ion channel family protein [Sulfurospirillum halorespirans]|uniref:Small conductance mechanosensitive ion channel (MscS) family protein n=1 Tax=Sulfurospirillum halorespirans DSM 13726 TaxID=1193502 RepID=A0A1D7TIY7_9BACT|nr:mechanosensitive ion channel domain-containing protein [Sulfurospirillum halorespirans]AOO64985.1 small conductance mechanosensitive ion channel (MscS) family protein [Sulfurospirillum halorespirans DSM 13726]